MEPKSVYSKEEFFSIGVFFFNTHFMTKLIWNLEISHKFLKLHIIDMPYGWLKF